MVKIIDASRLILGRLATYVAHQAIIGEKVILVNCEKAVVSGSRLGIEAHYHERTARGDTMDGPFIPRQPHLLVKRAIRGMLPVQTDRGKKAFARVLCFPGMPPEYADQKIETVESASVDRLSSGRFITIKQIATSIGFKPHG